MAEVSSKVGNNVLPALGYAVYVVSYSKANVGDTIDVALTYPVKEIAFAQATIDADGSADPCTWSGTTITLTESTGAGRVLVVAR